MSRKVQNGDSCLELITAVAIIALFLSHVSYIIDSHFIAHPLSYSG